MLLLSRVLPILLLLLALLPGVAAHAEGVELTQLSTERQEEALVLNFGTRFELPRVVEDALLKGVPIYFAAEASLLRSRWYWRDARVARVSRNWRLAWQPLTRQYRVSTGGLHQSYASLPEALASLRGIAGWRLAEAKELEEDGKYYLEFSFRLDTSQLPRPMQIGLGSPQGWALGVERTLSLNADLTSKP
ncbi:DUF4390 domain-containing protein [Roseateles sp. DAIF2]|uniref:DUF4390 domain-containing protein n=1 Tax=Roseateles sp. DAIF2 TaxID=2714952 RepID=UPI00201E6F64|nr:DUF4390 domain-containing protein [Roseateles sp. DAIF2]